MYAYMSFHKTLTFDVSETEYLGIVYSSFNVSVGDAVFAQNKTIEDKEEYKNGTVLSAEKAEEK